MLPACYMDARILGVCSDSPSVKIELDTLQPKFPCQRTGLLKMLAESSYPCRQAAFGTQADGHFNLGIAGVE